MLMAFSAMMNMVLLGLLLVASSNFLQHLTRAQEEGDGQFLAREQADQDMHPDTNIERKQRYLIRPCATSIAVGHSYNEELDEEQGRAFPSRSAGPRKLKEFNSLLEHSTQVVMQQIGHEDHSTQVAIQRIGESGTATTISSQPSTEYGSEEGVEAGVKLNGHGKGVQPRSADTKGNNQDVVSRPAAAGAASENYHITAADHKLHSWRSAKRHWRSSHLPRIMLGVKDMYGPAAKTEHGEADDEGSTFSSISTTATTAVEKKVMVVKRRSRAKAIDESGAFHVDYNGPRTHPPRNN